MGFTQPPAASHAARSRQQPDPFQASDLTHLTHLTHSHTPPPLTHHASRITPSPIPSLSSKSRCVWWASSRAFTSSSNPTVGWCARPARGAERSFSSRCSPRLEKNDQAPSPAPVAAQTSSCRPRCGLSPRAIGVADSARRKCESFRRATFLLDALRPL